MVQIIKSDAVCITHGYRRTFRLVLPGSPVKGKILYDGTRVNAPKDVTRAREPMGIT